MPCTTTQNTIGATIIEISFRKASLKIFRLTAKSGTAIPSTIPSSSAARTWTNSDVYSGFRATGAVVAMVVIERSPLIGSNGNWQDDWEYDEQQVRQLPAVAHGMHEKLRPTNKQMHVIKAAHRE